MLTTAAVGDQDAALMRELRDGDSERAMADLYDRYARRIYSLGVRLLSDRAQAEELVQETFTGLWRSSSRFDPERGSTRAFLFTIARRTAIDLYRRRPGPTQELPELDDGDSRRFDQLVENLALREALARLPANHREVLELGYFEDMTQEAIGQRLGIPAGTVKSRTFNALRALRPLLTDDEWVTS